MWKSFSRNIHREDLHAYWPKKEAHCQLNIIRNENKYLIIVKLIKCVRYVWKATAEDIVDLFIPEYKIYMQESENLYVSRISSSEVCVSGQYIFFVTRYFELPERILNHTSYAILQPSFEPGHSISYKIESAPSEDSD